MSSLSKPYTFSPNTYAVGSQVNSDFDTLYSWVNANAIWADASVAFTAVPSGPNLDPTANNHLTRKSYVDAKIPFSGKMQAGQSIFTLNAAGGGQVTFPTAFTNPVQAVLLTPGDNNVIGLTFQLIFNQISTTGFGFQAYYNSGGAGYGAAANQLVRIMWLAIAG